VLGVSWSRSGDQDCLRVTATGGSITVVVRPAVAASQPGTPAMAGTVVHDGEDACFVPKYGFVDGTTYVVEVGGGGCAEITRPLPERARTGSVVAIHPTATEVPRNLLRIYVWFSVPMSEGQVSSHVRFVDGEGAELPGAIMPGEYELWDPSHRRLTVLLDPARIKRGLVPHRQLGYPFEPGRPVRLVVDPGFLDAHGAPLAAGAQRRYEVGPDERRLIDPVQWGLRPPPARSTVPLQVIFDRPLDHGLLSRCLTVRGGDGRPLPGIAVPGPEERSWNFSPQLPWAPESHEVTVDPVLEDVSGNSLTRVFDRDLAEPAAEPAPRRVIPFAPAE
jgi:hypothetical protein